MNSWPSLIFGAMSLIAVSDAAVAALDAVDPGPYTVATGRFPQWYRDLPAATPGSQELELCQSRAVSSRVAATVPPAYMCTLGAVPGLYDDAFPMVYPDNFPDEMFWYLLQAQLKTNVSPIAGYGLEIYTAGVEAAFATDPPTDGSQQSFARIRMRIDIPAGRPGTYTVTHPYGVDTFNVTTTGRRAINLTRDIGIGAPGDFSGALTGNLGPWVKGVGGPYTEIDPETGAQNTYLGDPNVPEAVTGSPFGTNFVKIEGPAGTLIQNLFTVSGKVRDPRVQTPVEVRRGTYSRNGSGTRVELFASSPNSSALCYRETLALIPGTPASPCQFNMLGDNNGNFFVAHSAQTLPPFVILTATNPLGTTKPTAVSAKLVDVVKIINAQYAWSNHTLTLQATSSDETSVPDMIAQGFGPMTKSGVTQQLTVPNLSQPPAFITVKSARGGEDTEAVVVVGTAPNTGPNQPPVAVNDSGSTGFGVPVTLNVLANDSDPDNDVPLSVSDLTQPATGQGTVALNGSTSIVYTPPAVVNAPLTATFTYKAVDSKGLKSLAPATVSVTVTPNRPPVAGADTGATLAGSPLVVNVLANDTDPEGNVPLTVNNLTQPAVGRGTVTTNGTTVTYTPPATITAPFTATFTYQAADSFGALSTPATVNISVTAPPAGNETLTITSAAVQVRGGGALFSWDISGTSSVTTGNTIVITVTTPTGVQELDRVTVPVTGRWRSSVVNTIAPRATNPTATATSSKGTVRTLPITVR
ncbi:Ig-like domain-containing protein [Pseudomonas sp. NPDC090201]|uniref:Ig-like domain-containing protein n=1 Tax=Pseudomonas sp. NPDC090201 TaxID=3364475 RepID=UPI0038246423